MRAAAEKARAGVVTAKQVESASARAKKTGIDVWLTDAGPRGAGRFMVRCTPAGSTIAMFRYMSDGRRDTLKVGDIDLSGVAGLTLAEARARAGELTRLYQSGISDLRAHFAQLEQAERSRTEVERAKAEAERQQAELGSLQALLDSYVKSLGTRSSASDARGMFKLHVSDAFPALASAQAASIEAEQFRDVLARLIQAGKGRTAGKLRSYLRAAFASTMRATLDPRLPAATSPTTFAIKSNPLDRLPSLADFNNTRERNLTLCELRCFWKRLEALPVSAKADAVMSSVLLGGQRPMQLLRVTAADVDLDAGTVTLRDVKGKSRHLKPRLHLVPIVDELRPIIERRMKTCAESTSPLFSAGSSVPLRQETASAVVTEVCEAMQAAGELERGLFQWRDLRRTAETMLASMGVSKDVRAQLLSHGLGGVQSKSYDRHSYASEKRAALELWAARVTGKAAPVVPITSKREAAAA